MDSNNSVEKASSIHLMVLADVQYADKEPAENRFYRESAKRLQEAVDYSNEEKPDAVIQLGDLIDGGQTAFDDMRQMLAILEKMNVCTCYHVVGNHDFIDLNRDTVFQLLGLQNGYYAVEVKNWRIIVLDALEISIQGGWDKTLDNYRQAREVINSLQSIGAENAKEYNGGISDHQLEWLDEQLYAADNSGQNVLVFGHLPLMPKGEKHLLYNSDDVTACFEKHPSVKAYFCGHRHTGGDSTKDRIHYITLEAMVESSYKGGWASLKADSEKIEIHGFGNVKSRTFVLE